MHDPHQRGTEETVMKPVAGLQLGDYRVLAHLVGLLAADRLVHRRVETRANRLDGLDPDGTQRLLELDHHHAQPVQELLATAIPGRVADGATEVVENGKERLSGVLGCVPPTVGELLGLAPAEVLEVGGEAQQLVTPLGELGPQDLDALRSDSFGGGGRHPRDVRRSLTGRGRLGCPPGSLRPRTGGPGGGDARTGGRLAMGGADGSPVHSPPRVVAHPWSPRSPDVVNSVPASLLRQRDRRRSAPAGPPASRASGSGPAPRRCHPSPLRPDTWSAPGCSRSAGRSRTPYRSPR